MENNMFIEQLMNFGLTRQEAAIYECMLTEGKITGYEVAKQIGISRSNAYNIMRTRGFPSMRVGVKRIICYRKDFDRWIADKLMKQ